MDKSVISLSSASNGDDSAEAASMDLIYLPNEFPKGDLQDSFRHLRRASKDKRHVLLAQFLDEATSAMQQEVSHLSDELRGHFSNPRDVLAWSEDNHLREGPLCGAVEGALLIIVQLSILIGYDTTKILFSILKQC
jgi:monodictyphenone polyketide synthase